MRVFELIEVLQFWQEIELVHVFDEVYDDEPYRELTKFNGTKQELIECMTEEMFADLQNKLVVISMNGSVMVVKYGGR